jgi:hypothetical protein
MYFPATLRAVIVSALQSTGSFDNVISSRDVRLAADHLPAALVYLDTEERTLANEVGTAPLYDCTITVHIELRAREVQPHQVEATLDAMIQDALDALFASPDFLITPVSSVPGITIKRQIQGEDENPLGGALIEIRVAYQTDTALPPDEPLTAIQVKIDLVAPFDATGTYDHDHPAPRTSGPDGRVEVLATIPLT